MRIIAGAFRRRNLISPPGMNTRPMPDRVKESLFSMLGTRVQDANVLDAFAGSGAVGLEALSRGAKSCLFVEMDKRAAEVLQQNIAMFKCEDRATVVRGDALGLSIVARCPRPLDLAFFDPPYPLVQTPIGWRRVTDQCVAIASLLSDTGFVILRTPHPHQLCETPASELDQGLVRANDVPRRYKKHKKPRHNRLDDYEMEPAALAKESKEADADLTDEELAAMPLAEGAIITPASPVIEGIRGPETHVYGTMAVHFYMKRQ